MILNSFIEKNPINNYALQIMYSLGVQQNEYLILIFEIKNNYENFWVSCSENSSFEIDFYHFFPHLKITRGNLKFFLFDF